MAATATKKKGREQKANSQRGKLQAPDLSAFYGGATMTIEPGLYEFQVLLVRPEEPAPARYLKLDRANVGLEWTEGEGSTMTGTLTLRRVSPTKVATVPVLRGHRIRLQLRWGGRWGVLWDMQVTEPPETDVGSGTLTCSLADPLSALQLNEKEWEFKKDKQHPDGWTADQITRFVCKDQKVRIGTLAQGKVKIKKLKLKKGSGLEAIRRAYAREKRKTGRRFVIRMRNGRLDVVPFGRPGKAFVVNGIEKNASTTATAPSLHPTTVIKAKGHIRSGGKNRKVEETVVAGSAAARFGRSEKEVDYGKVDSRSELREEAQRDLSEGLELERGATLTIPGIPFIEKGSQIVWRTNEPGWHGKVADTDRDRAYAWTTTVAHSLQPASYETTFTLSQDDLYLADRERRDNERRDKAKKERDGRKSKQKGKSG